MEKEPASKYEIRLAVVDDIVAIRAMQAESWRDTYENNDLGVTKQWLAEETASWLSPEQLDKSREMFAQVLADPTQFYRVAYSDGKVVGFLHISTYEDGTKHLWGLYTDQSTHGTGLAQQLMASAQEFMADNRIELKVASYNERAKMFYRKYGFEETDKKNPLLKGKIPSITMVKKGHTT